MTLRPAFNRTVSRVTQCAFRKCARLADKSGRERRVTAQINKFYSDFTGRIKARVYGDVSFQSCTDGYYRDGYYTPDGTTGARGRGTMPVVVNTESQATPESGRCPRAIKFISVWRPSRLKIGPRELAVSLSAPRAEVSRKNIVLPSSVCTVLRRWKIGENADRPREKCAPTINVAGNLLGSRKRCLSRARVLQSLAHSHVHLFLGASASRETSGSSPFTIFIDTKCENSSPWRRHLRSEILLEVARAGDTRAGRCRREIAARGRARRELKPGLYTADNPDVNCRNTTDVARNSRRGNGFTVGGAAASERAYNAETHGGSVLIVSKYADAGLSRSRRFSSSPFVLFARHLIT